MKNLWCFFCFVGVWLILGFKLSAHFSILSVWEGPFSGVFSLPCDVSWGGFFYSDCSLGFRVLHGLDVFCMGFLSLKLKRLGGSILVFLACEILEIFKDGRGDSWKN